MSIASVSLPGAALRWRLEGPAGTSIDALVACLIGAGVHVEPIVAGTAYRIEGPSALLQVLADELKGAEGFSLAYEMPPTDAIWLRTTRTPAFPPVRSIIVHGGSAALSWVARAVDAGLDASTVGINRWNVTGRTAALLDWAASMQGKTVDDVRTAFGLTPEVVAAEDSPPATVSVALPPRRTVSEITRDDAGAITQVVQLETTP